MSRLTVETEKRNSNSGFSLVELIVVVSIIAIAAVPLIKSMGMASRTNAKAQSIQSATSLGESVMEEFKSSSMDEIIAKYGPTGLDVLTDNGTDYLIELGEMTATKGDKFTVNVTVDKASYSGNDTYNDAGDSDAKKENVGSANTLKIPKIEDVDSQSQAVLSKKELNKYDTEALNYFNQKLPGYNPVAPTPVIATIASKTIKIEKDNAPGTNDGVSVTATVTYTDGDGNSYVRDLYTGTFIQQGETGSKKYFDSNIYIFYTVGSAPTVGEIREIFDITDSSDTTAFEKYDSTKPMDSHKVFFIRQNELDVTGPVKMQFSGTTDTFDFSKVADLTDGRKKYGDCELVTNLAGTITGKGHIYKEEARTRVYDITVELYKGSELVTTLNSTVSANDP